MIRLALALALFASPALAAERPAPIPGPLKPHAFKMPVVETGKLSNGVEVRVARNAEVPTFEATVVIRTGGFADPAGKSGVASATFDMMDEGAAGKSASEISSTLKRLASSLSASAGDELAYLSASGLTRNLAPTLDLMADVLLRPDFPESAWQVVQQRRISNLEVSLKDPATVAGRVLARVSYGDAWRGRLETDQSLKAITLADLKSFHESQLSPANAMIVVGGDVTLKEVLPLLEARFGAWKAPATAPATLTPALQPVAAEQIYVVDMPGATQSVIRSEQAVPGRTAADRSAFAVANNAFARAFTGRVNMNLREDKGWTYGARCSPSYALGEALYSCSAPVRADVTAQSLAELRREMTEVLGERPLTEDEVKTHTDSLVYRFPQSFETVDSLLGHEVEVFGMGEPADALTRYLPELRAVTQTSAQQALASRLSLAKTQWVVVGDLTTVLADIEALGLPVQRLDSNGLPVSAK